MSKFSFAFNDTTKWLYIEDAYLASQFAKKFKKALEIGVYKGGWLISVKENNQHLEITGIDPYPNMIEIRKQFLDEIYIRNFSNKTHLFSNWTEFKNFHSARELFDLIHIDGEHSESGVFKDLNESIKFWNESGLIIVDDIFSRPHPGVTSAVFKFLSEKKLAPFLLTNKKLYICDTSFYKFYYDESKRLLNVMGIKYQEDLNSLNEIYHQSNSIFGKNILIKLIENNRLEQWRISKNLEVKYPYSLQIKNLIFLILPPINLSVLKWIKFKFIKVLKNFKSNSVFK